MAPDESKLQRPTGVLQRAPSGHLGPEYKRNDEKPSATVSTKVAHENVTILPQTPQLIALLTYVPTFTSLVRYISRRPEN